MVDAVGRILLIERCDALKYGYDPAAYSKGVKEKSEMAQESGKFRKAI